MNVLNEPVQGSLFEEDYLRRTLGSISTSPDVALTELVANAWDAGASEVQITIPPERDDMLIIQDDGCGMTPGQFRKRWMMLGYNRAKHQGEFADFPPQRIEWRRRAYGRNGIGRHSLLCFADEYEVVTRRNDKKSTFVVSTASGRDPFVLLHESVEDGEGHGTELSTRVARNLPNPDRIREVLASRFLSDPQFCVFVNGTSVPLTEHEGLIDRRVLSISDNLTVEALFFELDDSSKRVLHHGVAFWVGGRLVGHPTWTLGDRILLDGRTRLAKRHTIVVRSDSLFDLVLPDWSAFKQSEPVNSVFSCVADYVEEKIRDLSSDRIQQTKEDVFRAHRSQLEKLEPLGRLEIGEVVNHITSKSPTANYETISTAVEAAIHIEKMRSGAELLEKLSQLSEEDVDELNRLLSEWTVRDALTVLDVIDRRIAVIEALEKLSSDPKVDELHTLHPLVTQARWLFGPEFDSPEYASNVSLVNAVKKVFKKRLSPEVFLNARKRPDLVILDDASLSVVGTEEFEPEIKLIRIQSFLVIELKRGDSTIGRKEMNQASGYVEDLLSCGAIDGRPFIRAFVVGHRLSDRIQCVRKAGEPEVGRIEACTYGQLVRTASRRLFALRDRLRDRYADETGDILLAKVLAEPKQYNLSLQRTP